MSFNRYSLSTQEYYDQEFAILTEYLKNVKPEFRSEKMAMFLKRVEQYDAEKKQYDSLTDEQKIQFEIDEFQQCLQREIRETSNIRHMLTRGKFTDDSTDISNDENYLETVSIVTEFKHKRDFFEKIVKTKIKYLGIDPPLSSDEEKELINRMLINEYGRLNNNLISYNYFLAFLSSMYGNNQRIELSNFNSFKCNILMFLLDVDYEKNSQEYENYSFPNIPITFIANHVGKDNREDDLTVKAKSKRYAKILRDAASHGEFYPSDQRNNMAHMNLNTKDEQLFKETSIIRIENSSGIPRIGLNIQYRLLSDFVMSNLSNETKKKYDFLVTIIEADTFENAISNCSKDDMNQMIILILNNIIQYNIEHHYKEADSMIDSLDLSMFKFYDELNNGLDITSNLTNKEKLMNIKNALGHDHIEFVNDDIVLINEWQPTRPRDIRPRKKNKIVCSRKDIISFLLQNDLYKFSITNQATNSIINTNKNIFKI